MFNLFNCMITWESVGPFAKIGRIMKNYFKPSGDTCITKADKKRNARIVANCWLIMFAVEIFIVQYGSIIGLNLAPLSPRDYATTFLIGLGSMIWYIVTLEIWNRFKKKQVIQTEQDCENDDNF